MPRMVVGYLIYQRVVCADWVPGCLQDDTQDSLREQMRLDPSAADEYGFIYAFEIDGKLPTFISFDQGYH